MLVINAFSPFIKQLIRPYIYILVIACTPAVILCLTPRDSGASGNDSGFRRDGRLTWLSKDGSPITTIDVEIAETRIRRGRGLKNRPVPDFSQGMLFIYKNTAIRTFIMTGTPASLDIIFMDENSRIINIHRQTRPMSDQTYRSSGPARYVVEVRAGFCDRYGIRPGTRVRWQKK
ncbi:MAG: DUF192 domain-containing protein [Desulfobacterales bacterium]|nr:DUF192 domain-containing protein [Desulfobacterales bacterium]